jgi:hypothetical protein
MIRIILTILLVSALLKFISFGGTLANFCKYDIVKLSADDEEGENKKGSPEASKYDNEDKLHAHSPLCFSRWYTSGEPLVSYTHHWFYSRFNDKPNTPPPNLL